MVVFSREPVGDSEKADAWPFFVLGERNFKRHSLGFTCSLTHSEGRCCITLLFLVSLSMWTKKFFFCGENSC